MRAWVRFLALVGLLVMLVAVPAGVAARVPVPFSLDGEQFSVTGGASAFCNGPGTVAYTASGTATGPFPGTFTESGSVTRGGSSVTAATGTFTIASAAGTVTGSFAFSPAAGGSSQACIQDASTFITSFGATYSATLSTPGGTFRDGGTTNVLAGVQGGVTTIFSESFAATPRVATAITAVSGSGQSAPVGTPYPAPLQAQVTDQFGNPIAGAAVTFKLASIGAEASFAGRNSATATTNAQGIATAPRLTASGTAGTVRVVASTPGVSNTATFVLNNGGSGRDCGTAAQPRTYCG